MAKDNDMHDNQYQAINPFVLYGALGEDLESFRSLSRTFLVSAPPMFVRLKEAMLSAQRKAISYESHSLKGTMALVGATQMTALLNDIEELSLRDEPGRTAPTIDELTPLFETVVQEVQDSIVHFHGEVGRNGVPLDQA